MHWGEASSYRNHLSVQSTPHVLVQAGEGEQRSVWSAIFATKLKKKKSMNF